MGKLILGIIIGIASSVLVFSFFDSTIEGGALIVGPTTDVDASLASKSAAEGAAASRPQRDNQGNVTSVVPQGPSAPTRITTGKNARSGSQTVPEDVAAREIRLREEIEQAQIALDRASSELQELAIARLLEENPEVSPSPLPPEFDWVAEETLRGLFHERFEREPIDAAWSATMEAELTRFIYEQPGLVQRYGPPTIRCHTTRCEAHFMTTLGDGEAAYTDVRALHEDALDSMPGVFDCLDNLCWAEANHQDGITTVFWGLARKHQQPQSLVASATE